MTLNEAKRMTAEELEAWLIADGRSENPTQLELYWEIQAAGVVGALDDEFIDRSTKAANRANQVLLEGLKRLVHELEQVSTGRGRH